MTTNPQKLYGPKQIAIISCSMVAGIAFYLFRRFHENGRLTPVDVIVGGGTLIIGAIIAVVIVRRGNRK